MLWLIHNTQKQNLIIPTGNYKQEGAVCLEDSDLLWGNGSVFHRQHGKGGACAAFLVDHHPGTMAGIGEIDLLVIFAQR